MTLAVFVGDVKDPSRPTVAELNGMVNITNYFEGGNVCENYPTITFATGGLTSPSVTVRDLWEVYPGLAGGEPKDFAADVAKAAEWSRGHNKAHELADRFADAAIEVVADMGFLKGEDEEIKEEK